MGGALPLTLAGLTAALWLVVAAYGQYVGQRLTGIPLLGQSAAVAAGAYVTAALTPGLPLLLAAAAAVVLTALGGGLVGLAVSRLGRGDPGLATWAGAWLAVALIASGGGGDALVGNPVRFVLPAAGVALLAGTGVQLVVAALTVVVVSLGMRRLAGGPLAPRLEVLRTTPDQALGLGLPVATYRCVGLATAAALGALGGAGFLVLQGVSGSTDVSPLLSVTLLAVVLAGGPRWWGPALGCAGYEVLTRLTDPAIATAVLVAVAAVLGRGQGSSVRRRPPVGAAELVSKPGGALECSDIRVALGGRLILDGVSLSVQPGEIHALLGPNGAGKTTLLGVITGRIPGAGLVSLDGRPAPAGMAARVRAGLLATSQALSLPGGLTARGQVLLAVPDRRAGAGLRHLLGAASSAADSRARSMEAEAWLALVGVGDTGRPTGTLTGVEQRLVQIARAAATGARVIALDEPAAGVERDRIAAAISSLAGLGIGVLLVEHDLRLIREVADRASVCVAGRIIASGDVADVLADPAVGRAYLVGS